MTLNDSVPPLHIYRGILIEKIAMSAFSESIPLSPTASTPAPGRNWITTVHSVLFTPNLGYPHSSIVSMLILTDIDQTQSLFSVLSRRNPPHCSGNPSLLILGSGRGLECSEGIHSPEPFRFLFINYGLIEARGNASTPHDQPPKYPSQPLRFPFSSTELLFMGSTRPWGLQDHQYKCECRPWTHNNVESSDVS